MFFLVKSCVQMKMKIQKEGEKKLLSVRNSCARQDIGASWSETTISPFFKKIYLKPQLK